MEYSVIIPVRNEAGNVAELHRRLVAVLEPLGQPYEIIFVNDASTDGTGAVLVALSGVTIVSLRANAGQSAAMYAGFAHSAGRTLITLDGDLENQPEDLGKLLDKFREGYDIVSGWRRDRWNGQWLQRRLPSLIANGLIRAVTGVRLHDYGCTFRVLKREVAAELPVQYDLHRMLPLLAAAASWKVAEVPITFVTRPSGRTKYGLGRVYRVLLDLIGFYFRQRYTKRALHFFGGLGLALLLGSLTFSVWAIVLRLGYGVHFNRTPLPIFIALFFLSGLQLLLMGLIADLIVNSRPAAERQKLFYEVAGVRRTEDTGHRTESS